MQTELLVPSGAAFARLMIRHGHAVLEGPNESRTLTEFGRLHLKGLKLFYIRLLAQLRVLFGQEEFYASTYPRSMLSLWELFSPPQVRQDPDLSYNFELQSLNSGLYQKFGGKVPVPVGMPELLDIPRFRTDNVLNRDVSGYNAFMYESSCRLLVACGHEYVLSMQAWQHGFPKEKAGLHQGEAYLYFLDAAMNCISVRKIVPSIIIS